jgi:hypothetical protein
MKIELLEDYKHDDGAGLHHLQAGEVRVVSDKLGSLLCQMGLAKDVDGKVETGTRNANKVHRVDPDHCVQVSQSSEVK